MAYPTEQRSSTSSKSLSATFSAKPEAVETTLLGVFDSLTDGILLMDEDFRFIYANQAARRISRILPEYLNSASHWEIYPATVGTSVERVYREVMATRVESYVDAFYFEPFDTWYQIRVFPISHGIGLHYRDITEQRRSQAAQDESEVRLRLALSATNGIGVWDWDVVNDCVYADERFARIYGVDPAAAAKGVPIAEFTRNIPAEDMQHVGPAIQKAVADGSEFISQYRLLQTDGSIVWVSARGRCSHDASGAPTRFSGVIIDITDQKKQEIALRESEARYRVLTELSPQSQWSASPEGLVLYANRRFLEYIGHDFVPKTGQEYIECFAQEDRERVVQVWSHAVATGQDYTIYARLIRASDGAARWWHLRALPVRDDDGKIQQWLGSANDIHEDRIAADKLRDQYLEIDRQRRELETIYSASPIGMALYDAKDLRLLRINDRQAEIFRRPAAEALGMTYDELTSGVPAALALLRRAAAGETILNNDLEGTLTAKPGEYRYWNINYSPILNEDGTVSSIAAATVETTHQKRAELALIQSEKLAAVGRMASSIAHEINNPLESVTNLIYIARQQAIMPEVQQILDLADQELRRVSIIANQTLRFHKQASSPREISCTDLYSTVLSLFEGRLKNSAIRVEKRKRAARTVACFEGDIRQVLNNLVGNAIDAMSANPTSTSRLFLRSREATDWRTGRRGLTLTIADTGAGMSPETRAHVFEAFFTTKGINGTGLGLWISAEIVERHMGRLLLRSSQNPAHHGTVFTLFLPFQTLLKTKIPRPN
jgi:PAS domain S-box-containing protein